METPVTLTLVALNAIISGYCLLANPGLAERLALHVGAVLRGGQYERLITSGFVHGGLLHFAFNMFTLHSFGRYMELQLGAAAFLILYLSSLVGSGLLMLLIKRRDLNYAAVGASGAISGVMFGFCLFQPFGMLQIFPIPMEIPALVFAIVFIGFSIDAARSGMLPGIAHEGHLGGALTGLLFTMLLDPEAPASFLRQLAEFAS